MQLAHQRQPVAVPVAEAGDLVRAVAAVADEDEAPVGDAHQHQAEQSAHDLGRGAVRPAALRVVLGRAVEVHQDRQRPGACGEGEADEDGEGDPLVAVTPDGVGVAAADRVAVAGLAVDLTAGVAVHGVVTDQHDRPVGDEGVQQQAGQRAAQAEARPGGTRQDAAVVGGVARGEVAERAQQVGDGVAAGGQQRGRQQGGETRGRGSGELRQQGGEHGSGFIW